MKKTLLFLFLLAQVAMFSQTAALVEKSAIVNLKVPATAEQILGKWSITKILKGKIEVDAKLISGSYFIFGTDSTYQTKVMGIDESGTWQFGAENTSVSLVVKGQKTIWNILKVGDNELIMQKGIRGNTVTFSKN